MSTPLQKLRTQTERLLAICSFGFSCPTHQKIVNRLQRRQHRTCHGQIQAALAIIALPYGSSGGVIMQALAAKFRTIARCSLVSAAHTFPVAFAGSTVPLVNIFGLSKKTGLPIFPAFYILSSGVCRCL